MNDERRIIIGIASSCTLLALFVLLWLTLWPSLNAIWIRSKVAQVHTDLRSLVHSMDMYNRFHPEGFGLQHIHISEKQITLHTLRAGLDARNRDPRLMRWRMKEIAPQHVMPYLERVPYPLLPLAQPALGLFSKPPRKTYYVMRPPPPGTIPVGWDGAYIDYDHYFTISAQFHSLGMSAGPFLDRPKPVDPGWQQKYLIRYEPSNGIMESWVYPRRRTNPPGYRNIVRLMNELTLAVFYRIRFHSRRCTCCLKPWHQPTQCHQDWSAHLNSDTETGELRWGIYQSRLSLLPSG